MSLTRRSIIITLLSLVAAVAPRQALAQTDPILTQYFEVPSYYNPAAVGLTDFVRFRAGGRMQWLGIENAPTTLLLTADMPLKLFDKRFGIGLMFQQDRAGLYSNILAGLQAGYKLKLLKGELTAAIQLGMANESFKGSKVILDFPDDYHQSHDDAIPTTDVAGTAFDMALGLWYTHKLFYAGVSCTHLLSPTIKFTGEGGASSSSTTAEGEARHYQFNIPRTLYFIGGSNIPIKNTLFEVMPSVMVASDFTHTTFEVTMRSRWKKFLTAGVGYRYEDAVSIMLAGEYKGFFISYSYDYPISAISKVSSGSHEILAGYSLKLDLDGKNNNRHKSIRIM